MNNLQTVSGSRDDRRERRRSQDPGQPIRRAGGLAARRRPAPARKASTAPIVPRPRCCRPPGDGARLPAAPGAITGALPGNGRLPLSQRHPPATPRANARSPTLTLTTCVFTVSPTSCGGSTAARAFSIMGEEAASARGPPGDGGGRVGGPQRAAGRVPPWSYSSSAPPPQAQQLRPPAIPPARLQRRSKALLHIREGEPDAAARGAVSASASGGLLLALAALLCAPCWRRRSCAAS